MKVPRSKTSSHPRCTRIASARKEGDDPKTDQTTKGAGCPLPGWQLEETASCMPHESRVATVEKRPEAVGQDRRLLPLGDCGSVVPCHRGNGGLDEGRRPKTDQTTKGLTQNSRTGNPMRKCPNCEREEGTLETAWGGVPQRKKEMVPKDPGVRRKGTRGPPPSHARSCWTSWPRAGLGGYLPRVAGCPQVPARPPTSGVCLPRGRAVRQQWPALGGRRPRVPSCPPVCGVWCVCLGCSPVRPTHLLRVPACLGCAPAAGLGCLPARLRAVCVCARLRCTPASCAPPVFGAGRPWASARLG